MPNRARISKGFQAKATMPDPVPQASPIFSPPTDVRWPEKKNKVWRNSFDSNLILDAAAPQWSADTYFHNTIGLQDKLQELATLMQLF